MKPTVFSQLWLRQYVQIKPTLGLWTKFSSKTFPPQLSLTKSSVDPRLNSLWRWRRTNKMPLWASPWIFLGRVNFLEVKAILDLLLLAIWSLPFLVHSWVKLIPLPFLRSHPWCRKWWRLHDMIPDIVDWRPSLFSFIVWSGNSFEYLAIFPSKLWHPSDSK